MTLELQAAYAACRAIAKREAKNFYYAFLALPKHKSDAMCAVYAFMRRADDIADDESMPVEQRRVVMAEWLAAWREARATGAVDDVVFAALNDTQARFGISDELLEQLVQGTAMDLEEQGVGGREEGVEGALRAGGGVQVYETFDELYRYCYLVASVVGLVCIKIFGYTDPEAEVLAEKTGIAFQLTNILRDVKEDAERGRIYLPLEDLREFGLGAEKVMDVARGLASAKELKPVMVVEAARAREFYASADRLIPMLDADSRAAMGVLVDIYRGLLDLIEGADYDVFSERVSVPTLQKMSMLAKGLVKTAMNRVTG